MDASFSLPPLLTWGLFQRGIGLILLISFVSLSFQVLPAVRSDSILPIEKRLAKLREDFPSPLRLLYFPTLLWFSSSDFVLGALPIVGVAAASAVVYGGPYSICALGVCYLAYLSLDLAVGLVLPWDTLLFEATVLALFLPHTEPLPRFEAVAVPAPALAWAFRFLLFRVMFGFGKQKFIGSRRKDLAYLKGFMINQPLLSPGGWYAHKLPGWILKLSVLYMFFVEVPAPFLAFWPGLPSVVCAVSTALLMIGIQLSGNFGYFSLLTIVAAIPLLDNITPRALELGSLFAPGQPLVTNAFVVIHTLAAIGTLPFNSWLAQGWHLWAVWYQLPRWAQAPLWFYRALHPFRWVHPYGVFPPNNTPGVKISLLVEVSWDRMQWHEASFKFAPSNPKSAPHFVAPHHPRGDQAIIYDTFGMNYTSLLSTMIPAWDPSGYCMRGPSWMFCQSIVRASRQGKLVGYGLPERTDPIVAVRVTTVMLEPISIEQHRATGDWWKRTYVGPHVPPQEFDPEFEYDMLGHPELWNFDAIFWRRRSRLAPLMKRALEPSIDPMQLALHDGDTLAAADVERFWNELVPLIGSPARDDLENLPATVAELQRRFTRKERRALYRLLGRFSLILVARLEPLYLYRGWKPLIPVKTYFHLWMLAHHIIGCGRGAYLAAVAEPSSVTSYVPALSDRTGLFALSVFRLEEMTFDAQKLRLLDAFFYPHEPERKRFLHEQLKSEEMSGLTPGERMVARLGRSVSGLYNVMHHLQDAFAGPAYDHGYPELYPVFEELETGEVVVKEYARPAEGAVLAPDLKSLPE